MIKRHQGGVALVLAMLVMTLSVVLVMPLFMRQEYMTRYASMQQEQAASRAVLRSALAYVAGVLDDDARRSNVDYLGEGWHMGDVALPVAGLAGEASPVQAVALSVDDAEARFNLANLSQNGVVDEVEVAALEKLLMLLHADPAVAASIARALAASQVPSRMPGAPAASAASTSVPATELADLLPGMTADMAAHLTLLPEATPVNVNTADALLLAARFPSLSLAQARQIVQMRAPAHFRDLTDFGARVRGLGIGLGETLVNVSVSTDYFLVRLKMSMHDGVRTR